jgi:hypothetical protein
MLELALAGAIGTVVGALIMAIAAAAREQGRDEALRALYAERMVGILEVIHERAVKAHDSMQHGSAAFERQVIEARPHVHAIAVLTDKLLTTVR